MDSNNILLCGVLICMFFFFWIQVRQENSKHMNEIIPDLYIGNLYAANCQELHKYNVKAVLNCAEEVIDTSCTSIKNLHLPIKDIDTEKIQDYFPLTCKWIEANLKKGKVLVHCAAGKSRSVTIVAAYLMWKYSLNEKEAMKMIYSKRKEANPNAGFTLQLKQWDIGKEKKKFFDIDRGT